MPHPKLVIFDGMPTTGKSTTSYNLAQKLPGWIFIDIWRIKDIFEPIGYSNDLDREEAAKLRDISKEFTINLAKEVMEKTQRSIILQETNTDYVMENLGYTIEKYNYQLFTVQLTIPLAEAIIRNKKRSKPDSGFAERWTPTSWEDKIKRKTKAGDIVVDTAKNDPDEVVQIILQAIGEKGGKHPYKDMVRKFW